jgi:hypothetical protein
MSRWKSAACHCTSMPAVDLNPNPSCGYKNKEGITYVHELPSEESESFPSGIALLVHGHRSKRREPRHFLDLLFLEVLAVAHTPPRLACTFHDLLVLAQHQYEPRMDASVLEISFFRHQQLCLYASCRTFQEGYLNTSINPTEQKE